MCGACHLRKLNTKNGLYKASAKNIWDLAGNIRFWGVFSYLVVLLLLAYF